MGKGDKLIEQILEIARFAPSSHNTQPWRAAASEGDLIIGYRPERHLKVGDADKRELFISLGCFIESVIIAAKSLGYQSTFRYIGTNPNAVAKLSFTKDSLPDNKLAELIRSRRSDRRNYTNQKISASDIKKLSALSSDDAYLVVVTNNDDLSFLAEMTKTATLNAMGSKEFRKELASWVRNNWTKKSDGMPAYSQGIPGPVSLIAKPVIANNPKVAASQAKKDSKSILNSAAVALIVLKKESSRSWIDAGRLYQKLCLTALQMGIKSAPLSAPVIDQGTAEQIINKLGLKENPVAMLRLGYVSGGIKATPRLSVKEILF